MAYLLACCNGKIRIHASQLSSPNVKEHAAAAQQTHSGENKEDDVILPVVYYEYDYVYGRASKRPMAAKCRHGAWQSIGTGSLHPGVY